MRALTNTRGSAGRRRRAHVGARRRALAVCSGLASLAALALLAAPSFASGAAPTRLASAGGWLRAEALAGAEGMTGAATLFLLLAAATLVSEDATCVAAGALAARGEMSFLAAASACLVGIFVGDVLLFLAGRHLGRPALGAAPLRWAVKAADVERSSRWFARRGAHAIVLSRFLPGTRLPTYFAAGLLDTSLLKFSFYFLLAAAAWTPLLVGASMLAGAGAVRAALASGEGAAFGLVVAGLSVLVAVRAGLRLSSRRGRRLLGARLRRLARWEFWPPWAFYPPVVAYIAWLAFRHRSLTLFTCANPAIPAGGFVGESKIEILGGLASSAWARARVARAARVPAALPPAERLCAARAFMLEENLGFPVVVKPDVGQRGEGVAVVRSEEELRAELTRARGDAVVQEYVAGREFGVFYYRLPGERRGRVFSITDKRFPAVLGDGRSTLEELILRDERAVLMARAYFARHGAALDRVPAAGEGVTLVEVGSHCRGALFLDGRRLGTPELEETIDRLSRGFRGFYFGRYDLRVPSADDLRRGRNIKVIELNGVTSEATSIYDPRTRLVEAYRTLFRQWRLAFRIGARNRARGAAPTPLRTLARLTARNFLHTAAGPEAQANAGRGAGGNIRRGGEDIGVRGGVIRT